MKITKVILLALALGLVNSTLGDPIGTGRNLIVPGVRLGEVSLGPTGAETLKKLPKPHRIDTGMSQTRRVWKWFKPGGLFDTLFIHTVSNGVIDAEPADGVTIDLIRCTAARFRTANGISVGSTLEQIREKFPAISAVENVPTVYDDIKQGIAFEFDTQLPEVTNAKGGMTAVQEPTYRSACIAIMVHLPGKSEIATQDQVGAVLDEKGSR